MRNDAFELGEQFVVDPKKTGGGARLMPTPESNTAFANLLQQQLHSLTGKKHEIAQVFPDLPNKPRVRLASGVQQLKLLS
jgi:hypothetical protein